MTSRSGRVAAGAKTQHKDLYRKLLLRRSLYPSAEPGAVYVPFIGDGDIAAELYTDRPIYGADLDQDRVDTARSRLPGATIIRGDCDGWPFSGVSTPLFGVADLDAYANPYLALDAFLGHAMTAPRLVIFGTDGFRQAIARGRNIPHLPEGSMTPSDLRTTRPITNFWWSRHVLPYLEGRLAPRRLVRSLHYQSGWMVYWGVVAE